MKTPSQPRAIYYVVAIQIWEYFSFYGMRALLILYLTHQLGYTDSHAIDLYSAYASLVYVTPILGGWLADRLLGNRVAVIAGAALMTLGHIVLGLSAVSAQSLYLALAIIICGYGLFKSNISCLLGELYPAQDSRREGLLTAVRRRQRRIYSGADRLRVGGRALWLARRLCVGRDRHVRRSGDFSAGRTPFPPHARRECTADARQEPGPAALGMAAGGAAGVAAVLHAAV